MNSKKKQIFNKKYLVLFLLSGVLVLWVVFSFQTGIEKEKANKEITEITQFVKEQFSRYETMRVNNKVKIQMDLMEKAMELRRCVDKEGMSRGLVESYLQEQHLYSVMILDGNMKTIMKAGGDDISDSDWEYALGSQNVEKLEKYTHKVVADTLETENGQEYYYAMMGEKDRLFICSHQKAQQDFWENEFSIEDTLTGFKIDRGGLVALSDGERILSSNDKTMQGQLIENCPRIRTFNSTWTPDKLVSVKENGQTYYGRHARCGNYYLYVFFTEKAIFSDRGLVMAYVAIFYLCFGLLLLTLQRISEAKLLESAEEARRANVAKTEFLRRMSHDIRTPVNGIIGMLNIGDHYADDMVRQQECRDKIRDASRYLFDLVNDVLDMSKMETGEIKLEEIPFDLRDMIDEVKELIEVQAVEHGLDFEEEHQGNEHWNVIGSPLHLRQILMNIAGNAVKYNKTNGSMKLSCREISCDGETVTYEFRCSDTGRGMSEEFQKHMFEPFSQEKTDARTTFEGTGLGLSIVQKLVEKMGGRINVVSEEGKGTDFEVIIPLKLGKQVQEERDVREAEEVSISGARVLVVEDNALNMEIAEFILQNAGVIVTKAFNGKEALDLFVESEEGTFDVILMDIMMPVMDGLTATGEIRKLRRKDAAVIPIIAMTANAYDEDRKRSAKAGMNGHLTKPLKPEEMIKMIFRYMN